MKRILSITIIVFTGAFILTNCENILQEEVYSQLSADNFLQTQEDAQAVLNAAYSVEQQQVGGRDRLLMQEITTDLLIERGGGLRGLVQPYEDFTWDPSHGFLSNAWERSYNVISRANVLIDRVPDIAIPETKKQTIIAEARFLRAVNYIYLFEYFGPTPLIVSSDVTPEDRPARASKDEFMTFVENELREAGNALPEIASEFGRATKGAALGMLSRFLLNDKEWEKSAELADQVIDSGVYSLFEGSHRTDLFKLENSQNSEFIYVRPHLAEPGLSNTYLAHAAPPDYQFQQPPKANFAAQYKTRSEFLNTFHPDDERKEAIITEYVNTDGETVQLGEDDARSFKFPEDLSATGRHLGNDEPVLRYADILLIRAEALNELEGPNQESIDLINMVREKANIPQYQISDFSSKEALRDSILAERGWEFFTESIRRQDLIRHGKFIELAKQRGKTAFDYQVRYPIPQSELDRNPNLEQNEGY